MKKMLLPISFIMGCLLFSCKDDDGEDGMSEIAEKNLEAMHGITKTFDTKDFSTLDQFVAVDAVDHAGETGDIVGVENMKKEYARMMDGMEGGSSIVIKELADDEYVMSWMRFTGKLTKDAMGMKAGDSYNMTGIEVGKFKDGKAVEHWTFMDPAEMMKMMGGMPPMMDSTGAK